MITRDVDAFLARAHASAPDWGRATAKAVFLVTPDGFVRADESAGDNRYMAPSEAFDAARALEEHGGLLRALADTVPALCFPGLAGAPDGLFPNNVYATVPGRLIVGRMRHPVRQVEACRADIRAFFRDVVGYAELDLSNQPHPCELTGALVIDRARGLGFCGLSERCDEAGARLMHEAFGLRATLMFDLVDGEYHTNVLLAVLAGRAALLSAEGFRDVRVGEAISALYSPCALRLTAAEQGAFVANAIALPDDTVWLSSGAERALASATRQGLREAGFRLRGVPLEAIEAAGGSLRCCVAELF
jgi:hypothetical protein